MVVDMPAEVVPSLVRSGSFDLGDDEVDVVLIDDGHRLLTESSCVLFITGASDESLATIVGIPALARRIGGTAFDLLGCRYVDASGCTSVGFAPDTVYRIMSAYAEANEDGLTPLTVRQRNRGKRCRELIDAMDAGGLEDMLEGAVGCLVEELASPSSVSIRRKILPDGFWAELGRMRGRSPDKVGTPMWWGKLVNWLIYDTLDEDVLARIRELRVAHGSKWHIVAHDDPAVLAFHRRADDVTSIARESRDILDLRERVAVSFGKGPCQIPLMPFF